MPIVAPYPKFRAVDDDNVPLVGGKLYAYVEGTSTPKDTYTDFGLGTANTNPVILDARGEADVWLDGAYKLILKTSADVTVWTVDSLRDLTQNQTFTGSTLAGTLTISSTAVTWSGNPTHSGNHTFSGNLSVNGNTVIGNASSDTLTVAPNAVTWSNNPTHSGNHTWSGNHVFSGTVDKVKLINSAVADGNTLDWYEEGTFTPALSFGGASVGMVYGSQAGRFVRIGRLVFFTLKIILSSKGTSTGSAEISGMPYSAHSSQQVVTGHYRGMTGLSAPLVTYTYVDQAKLLPYTTAIATGTVTAADDADFTDTSDIYLQSFYEVA